MSASTARAGLIRRPARAVPAGVLAVTLMALGGLGTWLLVTRVSGGRWPAVTTDVVASAGTTPFDSIAMQITAVVVTVIGVVLLLTALVPGRPSRVRILDDEIPGETAVHRRDLLRRLQRNAENVDGVHSVHAAVRRDHVDVVVETVVDDPAPVTRAATTAVEEALAELRPVSPTRVRVRTRRRR